MIYPMQIAKMFLEVSTPLMGPPGVWGIWGEGLFIFRELGSTANNFSGAGEQAHTFGDLGSSAKMQKKIISGFHFI